MGFSLKCPMPTCGFQTNASTKDQLMKQVMDHARTAHNLNTIPPEVMAKVNAAIQITP